MANLLGIRVRRVDNVRKMNDVTTILNELGEGNHHQAAELLPLVYEELRQLAYRKMARESVGQTLSPTGLVHEAYMRLASGDDAPRWENRVHFFCAAAEVMRRILIDRARKKQTLKRGGERKRVELPDVALEGDQDLQELLELNEALKSLERVDPGVAELVKLRFFVGLTGDEAANMLKIAPRTADSWWSYARAFLADQMTQTDRGLTS
jgi:RNA polymerase sigma factor (TIGR02999 family)